MTSKIIEIRDSATFIPALIIRLDTYDEKERYLLARAGYGRNPEEYVLLAQINGESGRISCDVYHWSDRTYQTVHDYVIKNFDSILPGDVIDVEYILGESTKKKQSEMLEGW